MRQTRPMSVCVVSILGIALIPQLGGQQSRLNSDKAPSPPSSSVAKAAPASSSVTPLSRLPNSYGKLPLSFEVNQGQGDKRVSFLAHGGGYSVYLTPSEALLSLHRMQKAGLQSPLQHPLNPAAKESEIDWATVSMQLVGSNPSAQANGVDLLPGKANYLIGSDPKKWHTDVPTYSKVQLNAVYPGVDLVYYGNQEGRLEHDFVVAAYADPNQIEFDLRDEGRTPSLSGDELILATKAGDVKLGAPLAYQMIGGQRKLVASAYEDAGAGHIRFRLGAYDKQQPLVIDPVLVYSAVFGGSQNDVVGGMGIDSGKNVYVGGYTYNDPSFPLKNPYQTTPGGAWVSKLNPGGTALAYSTYLDGTVSFGVSALAVDYEGRAYVGGGTESGQIPIVNAAQPNYGGGPADAFITVLNPAGNGIEWSTYLGGTGDDVLNALAVDGAGNLYATGSTSGGFPASHDFFGPACPTDGSGCTWVAKYSHSGVRQYADLYAPGGGLGIFGDSEGSAYVTGIVALNSSTLVPPTTSGAYSRVCNPNGFTNICGFVLKLTPAGDSLAYATTLGSGSTTPGATQALGAAIKVDAHGDAYVGGNTGGYLPAGSNSAFQKTYAGDTDGFVLELNPTGTQVLASTYLGGSGEDYVQSLALDEYGQVYVTGYTSSSNFPLQAPIQKFAGSTTQPNTIVQYFVTTLSPSLSSIPFYSTYFGTGFNVNSGLYASFIEVDSALNVYLAGTDQNAVKPTPGAYAVGASSLATLYRVFVSKLTIMDDVAVALSAAPSPVVHGTDLTYTIYTTSKGPDFGVAVKVSDTLPAGTTFVSYSGGGGSCTAPAVGGTGTLHCTLARLNAGSTWTVKLTVKVTAASGATLSNTASAVSSMQDFVPSNNSASIATKVD